MSKPGREPAGSSQAARRSFHCSWHPPRVSLTREHIVGGFRSPRPGLVIRESKLCVRPDSENGLHHLPARFHHVLPGIERRVAHHGIDKQCLISCRSSFPEARTVVEVHGNRTHPHATTWTFRQEAQRDSLLRLN